MTRMGLPSVCFLAAVLFPNEAAATRSAELYRTSAYGYGRFEARVRYAAGDGVVSSFFLWKVGSEQPGAFWNELDFEKLGADCHMQTNALYGNPVGDHGQVPTLSADLCGAFHVYTYEWTPDSIRWLIDGAEVRSDSSEAARAFAQNASGGMRIHFNVWPGDASFGGNFDPSIMPVHQYVDWVQYSTYANGAFTVAWREDFNGGGVPSGWQTANWASPKNLSTHDPRNVNFVRGYAVLSLTRDDATGSAGAMPEPAGGAGGSGGMGGRGGTGGITGGAGAGGASGNAGASNPVAGAGGSAAGGGGGSSGTGAMTGGASGTGGVSSGGVGPAGGSSGTGNSGGTAGTQGGTSAATGGSSSSGGNPGTGGVGATAGDTARDGTNSDAESGCGCRVAGTAGSSQHERGLGAVLVLALLGALRRRGAHASRVSKLALASLCFVTVAFASRQAAAVSSAEYYSAASYGYGRFEARLRFAAGDGVVGSFFLWKVGSEMTGAFWNELDFEKVGAACEVRSNANFGSPPPFTGGRTHPLEPNPCETYHTYAYEWTPDAIAWLVDGIEVRRETGATATAFAENATAGMQIRFNVWPGDATFGGNFNPDILPVHQYVDWVQFSSYEDGTFTLGFREDFDGALPSVWGTGNWSSPKNLSTHQPGNVNIVDGHLVLSLTEDGAIGPAGAMPDGNAGTAGTSGSAGSAGAEGSAPRSATRSACSFGTSGHEGSRAFLGAFVAAVCFALGRRWRSNRK